jgi:LacI family transcriptional regulator
MSDVAKVAKVSVTTVSHVLNKTRKVSPETESAVRKAVSDTGYWADGVARSLRRGKTETVGVALSAISNPYFGTVVHSIEKSLSAEGLSLLLSDTHDDPKREKRAVIDLLSHRIEAIILAPSASPASVLDILSKRNIPTVLIDRVPVESRPGIDAIGVYNEEPVAELVDHLVGHGHRRIGMISSVPGISTTAERENGYKLGLKRNNIDFDQRLIKSGFAGDALIVDGDISDLLGMADPPTALILGNNQITIAAMASLRQRSIEVPRDLAIAVFDDFPWAESFHPRLTAIAQPIDKLGAEATKLLLERMDDAELPPRHVRLETKVMIRESCGCKN